MIPSYEPWVAKNQRKYVLDCIDTNMLTFRGKYVSMFEEAIAHYLGVSYFISTFNGSVSLNLLLYCLGLKPGDEVITTSLTYAATVSQINLLGAVAVFVDSTDSLQMNTKQIKESITDKTRAILIPELYSDSPSMEEYKNLIEYCTINNIVLIEDSAESFACQIVKDKYIGTLGKAASFSFFSNKVITTSEGGGVATNDKELAENMKLFKNQSHIGGFIHNGPGNNFRMTNLQAAIGVAQLEDIETIIRKKKKIAKFYRENLCDKITSVIPTIYDSSEWMPVFSFDAERMTYIKFCSDCLEAGIDTRPVFTPIHLMKGFNWKTYTTLNNSESVYKNKFNLPSYPKLSLKELEYIVRSVNKIINQTI
jgi:perosamine synthetase